jgi:hypothetical protein
MESDTRKTAVILGRMLKIGAKLEAVVKNLGDKRALAALVMVQHARHFGLVAEKPTVLIISVIIQSTSTKK